MEFIMATTFHPPVPGSASTPIKFITGYTSRSRNSVGQHLIRLLQRFFEFALALGTGNGTFNTGEPARATQFDGVTEFELVFYGNAVPRDTSVVLESLKTLLQSCPYFIWSDPAEARRNGVPNIMYSPETVSYLSQLSVEPFSTGLVLKGFYMARQSGHVTHAYPFKIYLIFFQENQAAQFGYRIAFGGQLEQFTSKVLEFHKLRLTTTDTIELMKLEYLHKSKPVYLTRGRKLVGVVMPEIGINGSGMDANSALTLPSRFDFTTREAVNYAITELPDNQFSIMHKATMRQPGTPKYQFPYADYSMSFDSPPEEKHKYAMSRLQTFLNSHAVPPVSSDGLGTEWGLPHLERLIAIDGTFDIVEGKIKNAIGSSYESLVPEDQKMIIVPDYLKKLRKEEKNILHLSEAYLEQDFKEFLAARMR
jgi:hypothetical protein